MPKRSLKPRSVVFLDAAGTAPRSRCERCSAHGQAGLSLGRHRRTVCKVSKRKEKSHLRAAALALVLLLELQLKPKPHRSGQGTSQRHSLLTEPPTSARRLRRVQAERRGRRLPSLLFVLLPQHRCVIKRRHIIKHRHVQIKAAKQRLTPRSQQTPRPQAPRPYPPTSPGSPSEQLGSQRCSPITFLCLFMLSFVGSPARRCLLSPPRVGTHRQLHADVGAVEQRHPAGEHGPGLAGGGDVRGCALRLPQPLPLGVPPGRAPAQSPPEEAQHRCGSPHSMGRKKKNGGKKGENGSETRRPAGGAAPRVSRPPGEPGRASENGGAPREGLEAARSPPRSAARPRSRLGPARLGGPGAAGGGRKGDGGAAAGRRREEKGEAHAPLRRRRREGPPRPQPGGCARRRAAGRGAAHVGPGGGRPKGAGGGPQASVPTAHQEGCGGDP